MDCRRGRYYVDYGSESPTSSNGIKSTMKYRRKSRHRLYPAPNNPRGRTKVEPIPQKHQSSHRHRQHRHGDEHRIEKHKRRQIIKIVDDASSVGINSATSNYSSNLSVDVSNEMAAVNRDIEALLQGYESVFYEGRHRRRTARPHFVEESSEGSGDKRTTHDYAPLTKEQIEILSMDKPPLERLKEVPARFLKPRPPPSMREENKYRNGPRCIPKEKGERLEIFLDDLMKESMKKNPHLTVKGRQSDSRRLERQPQPAGDCKNSCSRCCGKKSGNWGRTWKGVFQNVRVQSAPGKELIQESCLTEEKKIPSFSKSVDKAINTDPMDVRLYLQEQLAKMKKTLDSFSDINMPPQTNEPNDYEKMSEGQKIDLSLLQNWDEEDRSKTPVNTNFKEDDLSDKGIIEIERKAEDRQKKPDTPSPNRNSRRKYSLNTNYDSKLLKRLDEPESSKAGGDCANEFTEGSIVYKLGGLNLTENVYNATTGMDTGLCVEIIKRLTDSMMKCQTGDWEETKESVYLHQLKQLRTDHLKHIQREVKHIEDLDAFLTNVGISAQLVYSRNDNSAT